MSTCIRSCSDSTGSRHFHGLGTIFGRKPVHDRASLQKAGALESRPVVVPLIGFHHLHLRKVVLDVEKVGGDSVHERNRKQNAEEIGLPTSHRRNTHEESDVQRQREQAVPVIATV